jgi:hypothetical protein
VTGVATKPKKRKKRFWGMKGTIHGVDFDSGFEKKFIRHCRQLGVRVERSKARVRYQDALGKWHVYSPDFYWPEVDFTIEVKGTWAFKDNHGHVKEKYEAAMALLEGRYTIVTEKELKGDFCARLFRELLAKQGGFRR